MIVLDTSFLVALFNDEDSFHSKALSDFVEVENEIQLISDYIALETATVLRNKKGLSAAVSFLNGIQATKKIEIHHFDTSEFQLISKIFKEQVEQISFIDASVIYLAKQTNSTVATYDKGILKYVPSGF